VRIYATCLVKNESDIIRETLGAAIGWCDVVYIHDTGSTDATWEIVVELAANCPQIVPFKQEPTAFSDDLRRESFDQYRIEAGVGDWWCPLDADEIYIDDPRNFLAHVPAEYGVVWSSCFEFMFTERDLERYRASPSLYANGVPIEDRLRYYANTWSERRFYRYRPDQVWDSRPSPTGRPYPVRIRYKHFQYRSPDQIAERLVTRAEAVSAGHFAHERREHWALSSRRAAELLEQGYEGPATWEERIADSSVLHYDEHDGTYVEDEAALPPIEP
jgi:glycosyltransferase involved in cell wall biosynthesis